MAYRGVFVRRLAFCIFANNINSTLKMEEENSCTNEISSSPAKKPLCVKPGSAKAWFLASRPKTLTAALCPVVVGTALAWDDGKANWAAFALCLAFAALMQIAANFINDLFDFTRGTDREDRLGPERACAQGWISPRAMKLGIALTVSAACLCGLGLIPFGGWPLVWLGVACVVFAFLYTTLLSYCGWGDVLVFVFFGLVPVCGTYFVQAGSPTPAVWILGAGCGLATDTLLVLNNFRDYDTDRLSGKRTLIVSFGKKFGSQLYAWLGVAAALCSATLVFLGHFTIIPFVTIYLISHQHMADHEQDRAGTGTEPRVGHDIEKHPRIFPAYRPGTIVNQNLGKMEWHI